MLSTLKNRRGATQSSSAVDDIFLYVVPPLRKVFKVDGAVYVGHWPCQELVAAILVSHDQTTHSHSWAKKREIKTKMSDGWSIKEKKHKPRIPQE